MSVTHRYLIGLDFGTTSARGVLIDIDTRSQVDHAVSQYAHGLLTDRLPSNDLLAAGFALHHPMDYIEAGAHILGRLGKDRDIAAIGIASTASSPLPAYADGVPLVRDFPGEPQAYVKLWKHARAQPYAEQLNVQFAEQLAQFGGRAGGEGLLAKAAETQALAPAVWDSAAKYIEAGDWIVWQLTGAEVRSMDFACFKALYDPHKGYPANVVKGLAEKLSKPVSVGRAAGYLTDQWILRTGIRGSPIVAVACIDSHAVLPAVGVTSPSVMVGALGTSSGFLALDTRRRDLPAGYEAAAFGAALPEIWCCEAGQAAFGDALGWFVKTFPRPDAVGDGFEWYNAKAALLLPGESGLLALDWFGGNRVPYADPLLSGLLIGLRVGTTAEGIYRALVESLAFGVRAIFDRSVASELGIQRIILASGVARANGLLVQTISNVLGRQVDVSECDNATATGAAIHGAVAAGIVRNFSEGAMQYGHRNHRSIVPDVSGKFIYDSLYEKYLELVSNRVLIEAMRTISVHSGGVSGR